MASQKNITIVTTYSTDDFRIYIDGNLYTVYKIFYGFGTNKKIGEAHSFEEAVMLARSCLRGTFKELKIKD